MVSGTTSSCGPADSSSGYWCPTETIPLNDVTVMYDTIDIVERARANQVRFDLQNVEFRLGQIEHFLVSAIRLVVITSNCFINFGVHKPQVFRDAFRVMDQIHKDGYYPLATSRELFLTATANILGQRAFGLFVLER